METDYYAAFGLSAREEVAPSEPDEAQGENEQETAEPADQNDTDEQENPQETGDFLNENTEETADVDETIEEVDKTPEKVDKQSAEDNAKFAAARRKAEAEKEAEIARIKADNEAAIAKARDEAYADLGIENPYTGQPIKTKADYDIYKLQHEAEQAGVKTSDIDNLVKIHPDMLAAKAEQETARQVIERNNREMAKVRFDEDFKKLQELNPNVKTVDDLENMENAAQFKDYVVNKGLSLPEAYKLANFETLSKSKAAAAQQAAINKANSKEHLTQTKGKGGTGMIPVPVDVLKMYKLYMPNATDAEIQQHYNKTKRKE